MSLNLGQAKADVMTVVAQIVTDWTTYPLQVESDNRTVVDQATQVNPYLKVEVAPMSGEQADMADHPRVLQRGQILLYAVAKGGSGEADANALLDFVAGYFDMKNIGTVRCHAATATTQKEIKGWWWCPAIVPYWYHRTST